MVPGGPACCTQTQAQRLILTVEPTRDQWGSASSLQGCKSACIHPELDASSTAVCWLVRPGCAARVRGCHITCLRPPFKTTAQQTDPGAMPTDSGFTMAYTRSR